MSMSGHSDPGAPSKQGAPGHVQSKGHGRKRQFLSAGGKRALGTFAGVGAVWLFFALSSEYFFTSANIINIFSQSANIALVAAGLTAVLIAGEIDLSVGAVQALSGAVAAVLMIEMGVPVIVAVIACLALGFFIGMANGLLTWKLAIPSFIATLAMLGIAQGAAFLLLGGRPIRGFPDSFLSLAKERIFGIPVSVYVAVTVLVAMHLLLQHTRFGRHIYMVGGDPDASRLAGIDVGRVKMLTMALCGLTAAGGGLIISARLNAGDGRFGEEDLLIAVAAVVIGGTSLFGGSGSIAGTAAGVLLIASIKNGLVLMNVQDFWQRIAVGVLILAAMLLDQIVKGRWTLPFVRTSPT